MRVTSDFLHILLCQILIDNSSSIQPYAAKRLPRAQPAQQPAGMVLADRPAEQSRASACCS